MSASLKKLRPWLEPAIAVVFLTLWMVAEAGRYHPTASVFVLSVIATAIAVCRVQPVASLIAVTCVVVLQIFSVLPSPQSTTWPVYFGLLVIAFVVAHDAPPRVGWAGLLAGLPLAVGIAALLSPPLPGQLARWTSWTGQIGNDRGAAFLAIAIVGLGLYIGAWALGFAVRVNVRELRAQFLLRTTAAQLGATELELAMTRERDRIAREVHDVLAHSLAVVIAQADGARFIGEKKPEKTDEALRAIADAARSSLIDVRTLVEALREEPGVQPQPGLADLDPLIAQIAGAGMTVDAQHFGEEKAMTPAQQLAVYRVVQESLTNALRHAGTAAARLSFDWRGPGLALTITSTGIDRAPERVEGHGIRGMKDRARLAGGWLTAGESETDGDFVVTLFLPTGTDRTTAEGRAA